MQTLIGLVTQSSLPHVGEERLRYEPKGSLRWRLYQRQIHSRPVYMVGVRKHLGGTTPPPLDQKLGMKSEVYRWREKKGWEVGGIPKVAGTRRSI